MAFAALPHAIASGLNGATTGNIDTTGADLIVIVCAEGQSAALTLSDSQSNTWLKAPPTRYSIFANGLQIQYALCSGKTSASHNFSFSNAGAAGVIAVQSFSGVAASPFDQENGGNGSDQPGSITPSENNELLIGGFSWVTSGVTITSVTGMTLVDQQDAGVTYGGASAYVIQTTAGALNPTWNYTGSTGFRIACQASFKAAAGGGGASIVPVLMKQYRQRWS